MLQNYQSEPTATSDTTNQITDLNQNKGSIKKCGLCLIPGEYPKHCFTFYVQSMIFCDDAHWKVRRNVASDPPSRPNMFCFPKTSCVLEFNTNTH